MYYTYDAMGNVKTRRDNSVTNSYINETFSYDDHNRLKQMLVTSDVQGYYAKRKDYFYYNTGNIQSVRSYRDINGQSQTLDSLGDYEYDAAHPHAVSSVGGTRTYQYDTVGNMTNRNGDTITYNPLNKPATMKKAGAGVNERVYFTYGVGGARYLKQVGAKRTYYLGKAYEEEIEDNHVKQTVYLSMGGKSIGIHTEVLDTTYVSTNSHYHEATYNRYFHTDALGSITAITNDAGIVLERRSYEPFGKIRAMDYGTNNNTLANLTTQSTRAFTGHEQISEISGLIHMNARVYDSDIGRFLSADTIIQDPHDSQAYNRYSYVRNNPLKYTDPTGNSWWTKFRDKWVKPIVSIIISAVIVAATMGYGALASTWVGGLSTVQAGALIGGISGAIMTGTLEGTLKGVAFGAISAGIANGIGNALGHGGGSIFSKGFNLGKGFIKGLAHGLSRAAISVAQGGTFKSGFASGFASSFFSPGTQLGGDGAGGFTLRTTIAGVVGGTASEIGGGKFSNGAISGAFVHMFNAEAKNYIKSLSIRQMSQVSKFKRYVSKMNLQTFNKHFGLNISEGELDIYKFEIYNQLNPSVIKGAYEAATQGIKDIGGVRSSFAPVKAVYHILGPNEELGYDFVQGTTTLRGVYEVN